MFKIPISFLTWASEQSSSTRSQDGLGLDSDSDVEEGMFFDSYQSEKEIDKANKPPPPPRKSDKYDTESYLSVLRESMNGAGRWAFGIAAIEIWTMNTETKKLERAVGGWWRDPVFVDTPDLRRLEDPTDDNYLEPEPLVPGLGAAGALWTEVQGKFGLATWRDLTQLATDPDQPPNVRLNVLAKVFGLANGMYFHHKPTKGIVMFYARRSVNLEKIGSRANLSYLRSSADLLGAVVSWETPRKDAIRERHADLDAALLKIKNRLLALYRMGLLKLVMQKNSEENRTTQRKQLKKSMSMSSRMLYTVSNALKGDAMKKVGNSAKKAMSFTKSKALEVVSKMKGGGQLPPPRLSNEQCLFALIGCFLSLLSLSALNEAIASSSGGSMSILLAPLGALVTCHYGLTSAPASQPRNSILGVLVASVIAVGSSSIPVKYCPIWVRGAVAPSVAIATTLALGIAHPPAGAVAVVFATMEEPNWRGLGLLLFGYVEAIFFAVIFINLHEGRTFPMYWGIPDPRTWWGKIKERLNRDTNGTDTTDPDQECHP